MASSPLDPSDLFKTTGNTQTDVPTITSSFDNLSTHSKHASSFDDMQEQVILNDNDAASNCLAFSPILSVAIPTPTPILSHDGTAALCNNLVSIDRDISTLQTSSEQHLTMTSSITSTNSLTPIKTSSIPFDINKSPFLPPSNAFRNNVIMPPTLNEPRVRLVSKQTELPDDFTESSIEITSGFHSFVCHPFRTFFSWYNIF